MKPDRSILKRLDDIEITQAAILEALDAYANDGGPGFMSNGQWVLQQPGSPILPPRDYDLRRKVSEIKRILEGS